MIEKIMKKAREHRKNGKMDESIDQVNKILSKDPLNREALLFIADTYFIFGMHKKALKATEFLNSKFPKDAPTLFIKCWLHLELGENKEAKACIKSLYNIMDRDCGDLLRLKGLCEYRLGNPSEGIEYMEEALYMEPLFGNCLVDLIEITCAEKCFTRAKELANYYYENRSELDFVGYNRMTYDDKVKKSLDIMKYCEENRDTEGTIQDYSGGFAKDLQSLGQ